MKNQACSTCISYFLQNKLPMGRAIPHSWLGYGLAKGLDGHGRYCSRLLQVRQTHRYYVRPAVQRLIVLMAPLFWNARVHHVLVLALTSRKLLQLQQRIPFSGNYNAALFGIP